MKNLFKKIWTNIKAFATEKVLPWLKKNWMQIVNFIVILVAYSKVYEQPGFGGVELILGLCLFIMLGYYIFWKLFGLEKAFKK